MYVMGTLNFVEINEILFFFEIFNSIFSTLPQSEYTSRAVSTSRVRYIRVCVYFCLLSIRCFNELFYHFSRLFLNMMKILKSYEIFEL
jgi:hypothetical protein